MSLSGSLGKPGAVAHKLHLCKLHLLNLCHEALHSECHVRACLHMGNLLQVVAETS